MEDIKKEISSLFGKLKVARELGDKDTIDSIQGRTRELIILATSLIVNNLKI